MNKIKYFFKTRLKSGCSIICSILLAIVFNIGLNPVFAEHGSTAQGLQGSFGTIDKRYKVDEIPSGTPILAWSGIAWRGERVHAQIVFWATGGANTITGTCTPLSANNGNDIIDSCICIRFIKYTLSGPPNKKGFATPTMQVADILDDVKTIDIASGKIQPVWVSIDVPAEAKPGLYKGNVVISENGVNSLTFEINLQVLQHLLPPPSKWEYHLDLWQHPWAVSRYNKVSPWSQEHCYIMTAIQKEKK